MYLRAREARVRMLFSTAVDLKRAPQSLRNQQGALHGLSPWTMALTFDKWKLDRRLNVSEAKLDTSIDRSSTRGVRVCDGAIDGHATPHI